MGLVVPPKSKTTDLIKLVTESKDYNENFTKDPLKVTAAEGKEAREYELKKMEL